jgi:tetraacyldisaccharide 4'-kinase
MGNRNFLYHLFSVVRILLYPFALVYGAVVWCRNKLYDAGFFSSIQFSVPVISVGNLSVGGTGKTPHVEYLVHLLRYQYRVATMSRGYKRRTQGFFIADVHTNAMKIGDEPMQYHLKFPELTVSVAEERMTAIPQLLQQRPEIEVVLLDDAYQHRSVKAGLNLLITDYSKPFYKDFILPYGGLREARKSYKRADAIIVSKCPPSMTKAEADAMKQLIKPFDYQHVFFTSIHYDSPYDFFFREKVALRNNHAILVCCIARPEPLVSYLKETTNDVHVLSYPDHHYFLKKDMEEIKAAYDNWNVTNKVIVTTEKDASRMHLHAEELRTWGIRIVVLPISIVFLFEGDKQFNELVTQYIDKEIAENNTVDN